MIDHNDYTLHFQSALLCTTTTKIKKTHNLNCSNAAILVCEQGSSDSLNPQHEYTSSRSRQALQRAVTRIQQRTKRPLGGKECDWLPTKWPWIYGKVVKTVVWV